MRILGTVKYISPIMEIGKEDKKTTKVAVCVEEKSNDEFPNTIAIDFIGPKIDLTNGLGVGDYVEIMYSTRYNRRGTFPTESIFNSIKGRKINIQQTAKQIADAKKEAEDLPF